MLYKTLLLYLICVHAMVVHGQNNLKISSDFPGGNIVVNKMTKDTVWLKPDLSFTKGDWFYWYFKISGISGKSITFIFDQNNVFARYGPAYSLNNDYSWKWLGENRVLANTFTYSFADNDSVAFFSVAFPYTEKDLHEFLGRLKNENQLIIDTLCLSSENRIIEKITIPCLQKEPEIKVLITARHHACEMMANYVIEGIIESLLNDKNLEALRNRAEFLVIPFVDKDGVENGEQGKNRIPRDHNRDYDGESVHNSTASIRALIPSWSENKLQIALDIHCPTLLGRYNECIYLVGHSDQAIGRNQAAFSKLLEKNSHGELKLYHENFLPFGENWNTSTNYSQGMSFTKWAGSLEDISMATSIEFPYSNVSGIMVSKDNSRVFGKTIAFSINDYFEKVIKH